MARSWPPSGGRAALSVDPRLTSCGRGSISATLFDVGPYPAAIPASDSRVKGEIHRMTNPADLIRVFDEIEDFDPSKPNAGRYVRVEVPVTLDDGSVASAWVYFYNAPLSRAEPIASGDYLEHLSTGECKNAKMPECKSAKGRMLVQELRNSAVSLRIRHWRLRPLAILAFMHFCAFNQPSCRPGWR